MTGIGKTTIGHELGQILGKPFFDSDHEIALVSGCSVQTLFSVKGEPYFRQLEQRVIEGLIQRQDIVLATGGGSVLSQAVRELLRSSGTVVYLRGQVGTLKAHVESQQYRPILNSLNLEELLLKRLQEREKIYLEVADLTIDCDNCSVGYLATEIAVKLRNKGKIRPDYT